MKIYLAGRYATKLQLREYAKKLSKLGFTITASWLYQDEQDKDLTSASYRDLSDIRESELIIHFTENSDVGYNTGGRHVEFGVAFALGKQNILVGPRENIFHHLPSVWLAEYGSFDELIKGLRLVKN